MMGGKTRNPYEVAKAGGRNQSIIRRYAHEREGSIRKAMRSLQEQIIIHEAKIRNPLAHVDPSRPDIRIKDLVTRYWPNEIQHYKE